MPAAAVMIEKALVQNNFFLRVANNYVTRASAFQLGLAAKVFPGQFL